MIVRYGFIGWGIIRRGKDTETKILEGNMSKEKRILEYLYNGGTLTTMECAGIFNTTKFTTRVSEWRREGHNIQSVWEKDEDGQHMRYFIGRANNG